MSIEHVPHHRQHRQGFVENIKIMFYLDTVQERRGATLYEINYRISCLIIA